MSRGPPYSYVELNVAADSLGWHNLYAIVGECSVPRPTRGSDMVCNLTLVDPSTADRPDLAAGVEMLCFAADPAQLPHVRKPGDIIRLHRVRVNRYHERPQLMAKLGGSTSGHHPSPGFSFCLFDSAPGAGDAPYQTSSRHYHFDDRERQMLAALRQYCAATSGPPQLEGHNSYLRRIKDVRPQHFFDIVCKVVAADDSDPGLRLLHIWDGSDALPFPTAYDTRQQEEDAPGLPPREREALQQLHRSLRPFALPLADMSAAERSSIPLVGTTLPLVFTLNGRVEQPAVGSWVKMRNLGARVVNGQLQAYYHRNSRWMPWQHEEQQLMGEYQQRLAANHVAGWAPASSDELLAHCRHRQQPWSTLRQVLLDTPVAQPRCYRVLVRLMDYAPQDPADMCQPAASCGLPGPPGRWLYTLKLLVEDATAQLDVILFGPDADCFFTGLPARDMRAEPAALEALQQRLYQLLGQGCQRDGGPWMELSLKTYFTDPSHPWQTRQYRVFDTSLRHSD